MTPPKAPCVLAIGIDGAEPTLVESLVSRGRLPVLARVMTGTTLRRVSSPADIGSGAVWPTFMSGTPASQHGLHAHWVWRPETMTLGEYPSNAVVPFWRALADERVAVGVLDVPFAPLVPVREGFAIGEWGPHDAVDGFFSAAPERIAERLRHLEAHPFAVERPGPPDQEDAGQVRAFLDVCLKGVERRGHVAARLIADERPGVAVIVFTEVHHASHYLWGMPALEELYEAVDRQVGNLLDMVSGDSDVIVFSLHGMRPASGIADFLPQLLCERGWAAMAGWRTQSWGARARSAFTALKRHSPDWLKRVYHGTVPASATRRLAQPMTLPAYDWARTRAFGWPTDQHGWIRVNLQGREAAGIVPLPDYASVCAELEAFLTALTDAAGRPLVRTVIRTAASSEVAQRVTVAGSRRALGRCRARVAARHCGKPRRRPVDRAPRAGAAHASRLRGVERTRRRVSGRRRRGRGRPGAHHLWRGARRPEPLAPFSCHCCVRELRSALARNATASAAHTCVPFAPPKQCVCSSAGPVAG